MYLGYVYYTEGKQYGCGCQLWCTLIIFPVVLPVSCMNFVLKTKQI